MSCRVHFEVLVQISENCEELKELGSTPPWCGTNDLNDDGGTFRVRIVGGASNVLVNLNGLTNCRMLGVKSTQLITLKKNSTGGEAWTIRPLGVGALQGMLFCTTDGITSLYLTNPGSLDAEVTIAMAGLVT